MELNEKVSELENQIMEVYPENMAKAIIADIRRWILQGMPLTRVPASERDDDKKSTSPSKKKPVKDRLRWRGSGGTGSKEPRGESSIFCDEHGKM